MGETGYWMSQYGAEFLAILSRYKRLYECQTRLALLYCARFFISPSVYITYIGIANNESHTSLVLKHEITEFT